MKKKRNVLTKEERLKLNGAVFSYLRGVPYLRIPQDTSDEQLQEKFGAPASEVWRAIRELESVRDVRVDDDAVYYLEPRDRW
jgi:hypothetical protein